LGANLASHIDWGNYGEKGKEINSTVITCTVESPPYENQELFGIKKGKSDMKNIHTGYL